MRVYRIVDEQGSGMYRASHGRMSLWNMAIGDVNDGEEGGAHPPAHNDRGMVRAFEEYAIKNDLRTSCGDYPTIRDAYSLLPDHRFGFGSVEQLRRWVYGVGWLKWMHDYGGRVQVYDVPDEHVLVGTCQVTFSSNHAARILPDLCLIDLEY